METLIAAAVAFSSSQRRWLVPAIGTVERPRERTQASASCAGVHLCSVDDSIVTAHYACDMDGELPPRSTKTDIFDVQRPATRRLPLVLASPHSGSDYPADLLAASRLDPRALRQSEDSYVDELFAAAPRLGAPLLSARFPRAYVDVNREAYELDPAMFDDTLPDFVNAGSPRARMGLGTIARIVASGEEIYAKKLSFAEANRRIECLYRPYHAALHQLVGETEGAFGGYLLVDCHSMPSAAGSTRGHNSADIVLGDCHGASCARRIVEAASGFLVDRGFVVAINSPYAGGFTTGSYGCPGAHRHALQIEINRALYMDEQSYRRKPRFARLVKNMSDLVERLGQVASDCLQKST
jgi:N-formylglutamate amidohydrolase